MEAAKTITATEFKAKCLDLLDRVNRRELDRVTITKRGRPVGMLIAVPEEKPDDVERLFGFMKGTVFIPPGLDLTKPVFDGEMDAEKGKLHR